MGAIREFIMAYRGHAIHRSAKSHRHARTRTLFILTPQSRWMEWKRRYITTGFDGYDGPMSEKAGICAAMEQIDSIIRLQATLNAQQFCDTWGPPEDPGELPVVPPRMIHDRGITIHRPTKLCDDPPADQHNPPPCPNCSPFTKQAKK